MTALQATVDKCMEDSAGWPCSFTTPQSGNMVATEQAIYAAKKSHTAVEA
jgi:hypothetical protein